MMKSLLIALSLSVSSVAISSAAIAQDDTTAAVSSDSPEASSDIMDKDIKQAQKFLTAIFGPVNKEPIAPQQLALAQQTVDKMMPKGMYTKMMIGMLDTAMGSKLGSPEAMGNLQIMIETGVEIDAANLDPSKRAAVTQMLDKNYAERAKLIRDAVNPVFDKLASVIEPPMREGMSRAYARKFTPAQLTELNRFFTTPAGAFYASEIFALQMDPEMVQSMAAALPKMFDSMKSFDKDFGKDAEAKMKALPKPRRLYQLSDTELDKLAQLLGTTKDALKMHAIGSSGTEVDSYPTVSDDPYANETGSEPWYDETNWTASQRNKTTALNDAYDITQTKTNAAYEAYDTAQKEAISAARKKFLANGWKPEPQDSYEGATEGTTAEPGNAAATAAPRDASAAARPPK